MENNALTIQSPSMPATSETASTALAERAKTQIQSRYQVANFRPRDLDVVRSKILKDCQRPGFASAAIYNKPIGKGVEGPSIRFAEAAIRAMGNIEISTDTVFDDAERRIVRVGVTDLEANVPYSQDVTITKTVERRSLQRGETPLRTRIGSGGQTLYILPASDDDILNKQNALISKAIRTLGLRSIPGDIVDEAMDLCRATMRNQDAQDPDSARRKLLDAFGVLGVTPEQVKAYLGTNALQFAPAELAELRGIYAALRDGETNWREVMDAKHPRKDADGESATSGKASLKDALRAKAPGKPSTQPDQAHVEPSTAKEAQ